METGRDITTERYLRFFSVTEVTTVTAADGSSYRIRLDLPFDEKENVSNCIQLKTSVIKGIKNQLLEQFPDIESWLNHIMPKKDPVKIVRCHEHIEILTVNGELLFFRQREGPFYPTLRLLHKYPFILPHQQVDKGAIKFVLSGANIMCPGLTSPGAKLYPAEADTVVVSFCT
ncbi:Malignant T-cell-amplified sequence 1 [Collichthys lucidus]|uniref:Malignant T-cell-amplified sequence 1 n=1 Tax=Collichthys lucidus TaxID=240159 RepID=A0A4U5UFS3_COLLU|nr:Malignant T-cell-amplified sequence 1 [Collichthys lucidus]